MTAFSDDNETLDRLDLQILQNTPVALYWKIEFWEKHLAWFEQNGYRIVRFDAEQWGSEEQFHRDISKRLQFPGYYGMNLNALNDCLYDLDFSEQDGLVLAIKRYDRFQKKFPDTAQVIIDIIADNAWYHLLFGNRLVALIQTDKANSSFEPVGARPVMWNPEEWLNSKRGL